MRRRVTLYIAEQKCDLSDDALVLLNIQREDLYNPAVVLNSYSQAVTLPGTAANDRIFGHYFRSDHSVAGGFNPLVRVPFSIFADTGEILVAGYCKLLNVTSQKGAHTYEVQLYGSLGEFIYGLAYDADGNKKTLASLDYLGGGDTELDFVINAHAVNEAWAMLRYGASLTRTGRTAARFLQKDGTLTGNSASFWVDTFDVVAESTYEVKCQQTSNNAYANVVAYDSGGGVLGWFKISNTGGVVTMTITMPAGTATIAVQGSVNITPSVTLQAPRWNVVNFAPCYNGIPDGDFDAGKALAVPADVGLTIPAGQQASSGGYTLLELAADLDEWEARDLRSYLQRPVLSVKALLEAIAKPENNGGWTIDLSDIDTTTEWPYLRTWLTRPLLPSLGTFKQTTGALSLTFDNTAVGQRVAKFDISGNLPGEKVFVQMQFKPVLSFTGQTAAHIYMQAASAGEPNYSFGVATFIQPIAYDSANNIIAYGNVLTLCPNPNIAADTLAAYVGFTPQGGAALISTQEDGDYDYKAAGIYWSDKAVNLEVAGMDIASVRIMQTAYTIGWHNYTNVLTYRSGDGTSAWAGGFTDPSTSTSWEDADGAASADGTGTATSTPDTSIRSGARITKRMFLSTEGTPADYLLAICKSFGLYILADGATKTASIVRRSTLYQHETIDLTERVDTSQPVELVPLAIESKYYDFKHADVGAAFGKEYKENTGRDYGAQRVNTGYDFDAKARNVLDGVVLKGTASVVKYGRFMIEAPVSGAAVTPPVFILPGSKYTLWDGNGDSKENDVPQYVGAVTPLRSIGPYDFYEKAQFHAADGKPVDGADVLLLYNGTGDALRSYPLEITDDVADMDTLNGKPCWLFGNNTTPLQLPYFSRYDINFAGIVTLSLDFGVPGELDIPNIDYFAASTIYAQAWKRYVADRLDKDTKVLRCRVRLDGLQVGQGLLRKFYWYRGSLWALNKITNYSLTTYDPAECEFIQVQDIDNYV